jgi:hypothetical protein
MKWVLSHATDELHHWLLQQEEGSRSLTINLQRLSLRLSGFSKRLFFIQVEGLLQKKILLRSEYGITIGETVFAEKALPGQLLFNGQKFSYRFESNRLALFDGEKNLVGECEIHQSTTFDKYEFYSVLFGFAWFLTADAVADTNRRMPVTA